MSDDVNKAEAPTITTTKQKNPGRVAAGKRLAELSRKRREAKKTETGGDNSGSWYESYSLMVGVVGLIIAGVSLMYSRKSAEATAAVSKPVNEPNVTVEKTEVTPRNKLGTLD